ncbi:MAG: peptide-methionine (S)-S-oxide reductase MsrA, partial [Anaerolineae bacterium]|nr:peptide-methionine (S)-S-oxide reductase MsrA [Anaerolineae bacterium]
TLAGGCFWCLEAIYKSLKGVVEVESGFSGGTVDNPGYELVCTGNTGHAEVVQLRFDPSIITFNDLLEIFFDIHDPTTLNRQGGDVGTQYRSAIFYHSPAQKQAAESYINKLKTEQRWSDKIVTEVTAFSAFYPAEDYHRDYFANHPNQPYCQMVVSPKVNKFRKHFAQKLKAE